MRRLLVLVSLAFVVSLVLAPSAMAQWEEEMEPPQEEAMESPAEEKMEEAMEPQPDPPFAQEKEKAKAEKAKAKAEKAKAKAEKAKAKEMPKTGGPSVSVIVPAAALLLVGSGVFAYIVVRRR